MMFDAANSISYLHRPYKKLSVVVAADSGGNYVSIPTRLDAGASPLIGRLNVNVAPFP